MSTHVLKTGDELEVKGVVRVAKCGLHREGAGKPEPSVTLEVLDKQPTKPARKPAKPAAENEQ